VAVVAFAVSSIGGSSSSDAAATERTATSGRGVVQATVSGNGSLEAAQQVELNFGASGEVTAIYVAAGEHVSKGEILARVDSASARASLASARASLTEAEETLEAAEEAEEESTEEAAYHDTESTTVLVDYLSGASEAEGKPTVPKEEEAEEPTKPEEEEEAKSEKSEKSKEKAPSSSEEAEPASEAEPSSSSVEGSSSVGGGGTVSVATAEAQVREARLSVRSAESEVAETTLRAPFAGTVASVSGEVGETVSGSSSGSGESTGASSGSSSLGASGGSSSGSSSSSSSSSAFIVLSQLEELKMEVSFSESDIGKVEVGQSATVSIDSMEGTELAGKVTKVDVLPAEGSSSGVVEYPATILLTQSAKGLRAGMSASAEVIVEEVKNAVTVPSEAISTGPTGKTVTVRESSGREATKRVTTGLVGGENTQIVSGLKAGETVVLPETTVATSSGSGGGEESGSFPGGGSFSSGGAFPAGGPPSGAFPGG